MTIGSLFSGIGGLELGLERAGLGPILWQVEQDAWCRDVLARHWPEVDRSVRDVREAGFETLPRVDLICGGFPCQDVSGAGKGAGLAGSRSGLWAEFARVIGELWPTWVVAENVASGASKWLDPVRAHLERLGYETLPIPLSAADVGAPHRRSRIFVVARRVPHPEREQVRLGAERQPGGRSGAVRDEREPQPTHLGVSMADGNGAGPSPERDRGQLDTGQWAQPRDHFDRCGCAWPWPPGPGSPAWEDYRGPEPAICRSADGFRCGLAREEWQARLKALGNAVVPQCAEVVGWVIRELQELSPPT